MVEVSLIKRTSLKPYVVVSAPSAGVSIHEVKNMPLLVQNKERMCEVRLFILSLG